jgi:hypothetical protein
VVLNSAKGQLLYLFYTPSLNTVQTNQATRFNKQSLFHNVSQHPVAPDIKIYFRFHHRPLCNNSRFKFLKVKLFKTSSLHYMFRPLSGALKLVYGTAVPFALSQSVLVNSKKEASAAPLFAPHILYVCGMPVAIRVCSV